MNYLSHFYIHQKANAPYFNTGLILPDLARGFVKSFKPRMFEKSEEMESLYQGCMQHYEADKIFHSSEFFNWGTQICIEELKQAKFQSAVERRWFIGHVMFEMFLDRVLVNHKKQVSHDFYDSLQLVNDQILNDFLKMNHARESEKLLHYFNHFRRVRYIINYSDNNLFVFSLSRVLVRAGLEGLSFYDKLILEESMSKLENGVFKDIYSLLLRLKQVFK
ncbi:MAG: hypothetical protein Q8M15_13330 [Bacteroidota bacterium]|nr:hypothetical protein [Bacteroidota bacterium]